ncbi:hypothetical protein E1281_11575 [Actinomadura sp. KC345]|uniref:helix-turn-helix transcriptional regulator n=1 Tax=Actinomadura sp. KC345 TaxID=2530371 RepID=UPI00104F874C|nr:AAA family ATPase [Actinomadura sp. KC345]TDC55625.1 hypothetical protein E1281_11575 [Actinomadura sp. KC345]
MQPRPGSVAGRLVGRDNELAGLKDAWESASAAQPTVTLVRGEAGIGKTVLLNATLTEIRTSRRHVIHMRADRACQSLAFGALADALASAQLPAAAAPLGSALVTALDGTGRRQAAARGAALQLMAVLRADAPTLLAVDDLEFLDVPTLALLGSLARRTGEHPLVVAATVRRPDAGPAQAHADLLEVMEREACSRLIDLEPLPPVDLARLVRDPLGGPCDDGLLTALAEASTGNPTLALRYVDALLENGAIEQRADGRRLRPAVLTSGRHELSRDLCARILHRVWRGSPRARLLADVLAVLGPVTLDRLAIAAELTALAEPAAGLAFDELLDRGILDRAGDGRYHFRQPLVRDAFYWSMGAARRWNLHRGAVSCLRALPATPELDQEIATQVRAAPAFGDHDAVMTLFDAAERIGERNPRAAVAWYDRALAITPPDWSAHGRIAARLTRALLLAGLAEEAQHAGGSALSGMPDGPARGALTSLVAGALTERWELDRAQKLIKAEQAAGHSSPRLVAQSAYVLAAAGRLAEADTAAAEVLAELDAAPLPEKLNALIYLVHMRCMTMDHERLTGLLTQLAALEAESAPIARLGIHVATAYGLAMRGDTAGCEESIGHAQALLIESGLDLYQPGLAVAQACNATHLGHWDTALSLMETVEPALREAGLIGYLVALRASKAQILAHRGALREARQAVRMEPKQSPVGTALLTSGLATVDTVAGRPAAARDRLRRALADGDLPGRLRLGVLCGLAEAELELGDHVAATSHLNEIRGHGLDRLDHCTYVRYQLAIGSAHEDIDALREGLLVADRHRLRLLRGIALLRLGTHGAEPEPELVAAIEVFQSLDAIPLRRRAAKALRARDYKVPRQRRQNRGLLTATETQMARLVQLGHANREIAETMSLSVKTVEVYLSRVYAKVGCSGRLELARALDRGLLDEHDG